MTDLVLPDQATPGIDLQVWAQQATAAAVYADRVCSTSMVPAAYRGKPAEACAAILAGAELGFSPMASLRAFDNIQGVPAPKAITLRAVVQAAGHQIRVVESTSERAVVDGRRKGDIEWGAPSIWTIERASLMPQYKSNPNYKTNPAAMLLARATAEQCRWIASDAIMGMPYAAEELDSEPNHYANARGVQLATRRLTVADLDEPRAALQPPPVEPTVEMLTDKQRGHMFALWGELGYSDSEEDRRKRLWLTAQILGLTEPLESSSDLTRDEADRLIDALRERKDQMAAAQGGES
jgi:hypothetical protein